MSSDPLLEKYEGKKFVFCLPGDYYSGTFLTNIVGLNSLLAVHGIKVTLAQTHSSCVHRLRNICGGGDILRGTYQTPFANQDVDYDYLLWIDSDIVFNRKNFTDLLEMDVDVATGWYYQPDGTPACGFIDKSACKRVKSHPSLPLYDPSHTYLFRPDKDIADKTDPYVIDWVGMGWMLIKSGVMEKIPYPWFAPKNIRATETIVDTLSEDLSFQLSLRDAGFEIVMNPGIRVGHEKVRVI
jgi:hypothetical protein